MAMITNLGINLRIKKALMILATITLFLLISTTCVLADEDEMESEQIENVNADQNEIIVGEGHQSVGTDESIVIPSVTEEQVLVMSEPVVTAAAVKEKLSGWIEDGSNKYYIKEDGTYAKDEQIDTGGMTNQRFFYFGADCILVKGIYQSAENGIWYYADANTGGIKTSAGFVDCNGNRYYVTRGGAVARNIQIDTADATNQRFFYFGADGILVKGIYQSAENDIWYYADVNTGEIKTSAGFADCNGNRYYVTRGGAVARNIQIDTAG
ncbi:MAG: hypothetical protein GX663_02055, partial [Clostridiales bacterium]|nr:hypothetical protein [Clostridiales bacterium]